MIGYGDKIHRLSENIYFAPYLQTIFETESELIDSPNFRNNLSSIIDYQFSVQSICDPKFSKAAEILLTDKCNLACSYCYSGGYRSTQTMTFECCEEIVKHLFKNAFITRASSQKEDTVYILFHGGGEPTQAWDELVFIVELANMYSSKYHIKVRYNLATNGVFSKPQLQYLLNNNFDFRVSLDGVGEINDKTRPMANQESSFPIVASNLDDINKSGHKFVIASVVTNENINEMDAFINYCVDRWSNLHDLRFFMLEETELTHKNNINLLNMNKFQKSLYDGIKLMIERGVGIYKKYCSFYDYLVRTHKGCCSPSIMHMPVYNCNGDILRCNAHVFDPKAKIGGFVDNKMVFFENKYHHLFKQIKGKTDECKECICSTYCEFGGDSCVKPIKQTEEYCEYMKNHFSKALCEIFSNPNLVSTSVIKTNAIPGIKKIIHWKT